MLDGLIDSLIRGEIQVPGKVCPTLVLQRIGHFNILKYRTHFMVSFSVLFNDSDIVENPKQEEERSGSVASTSNKAESVSQSCAWQSLVEGSRGRAIRLDGLHKYGVCFRLKQLAKLRRRLKSVRFSLRYVITISLIFIFFKGVGGSVDDGPIVFTFGTHVVQHKGQPATVDGGHVVQSNGRLARVDGGTTVFNGKWENMLKDRLRTLIVDYQILQSVLEYMLPFFVEDCCATINRSWSSSALHHMAAINRSWLSSVLHHMGAKGEDYWAVINRSTRTLKKNKDMMSKFRQVIFARTQTDCYYVP
jgi:hypothetical protein